MRTLKGSGKNKKFKNIKNIKHAKNYYKILNSVLKENLPDNKILKIANSVIQKIKNNLKNKGINADVVLGGSVAKDVFLKNDYDCDIFVRFDYKEFKNNDSKLSDILEKVLQEFMPKRIHGSRDYFQFNFNGLNFEVIPVLKIKNLKQALNIMDYSPLHVNWFNKNANKEIRNCVRLLKLFCKAQKIYGAESFVKGFSGHVIDIISVHYGSFLNVLKAFSKDWVEKFKKNEKIVIDVNNYHKGKALFVLNKSKIQGPLVVIDPIDSFRNASASLSYENFGIFLKAAKDFLEKPSKDFFVVKVFKENDIIEKALKDKRYLLIIKAMPLNKSVDVAGCKLLKAYNFIKSELNKNGFSIEEDGFYWSKHIEEPGTFYFFINNPVLSKERIIKGPNIKFKQGVLNFKKNHKKTFEKDGFVWAIEERNIKNIEDLFLNILNSDFLNKCVLSLNYFEFMSK